MVLGMSKSQKCYGNCKPNMQERVSGLSTLKHQRRAQSVTPPLPNHQQRARTMTPSLKHQRRTQEVNILFPWLQHKWQAVTLLLQPLQQLLSCRTLQVSCPRLCL